MDEHLAWYEGAGTSDRRWIVQDDLGSVVAVTNSSGAALSVNSYDEYGNPASGNSGLFGYTGQMYLQAAGLYHYRARAYSPAWGRFLQTDPIGMGGGMHLYAYVNNDPLNWIDPLGLQTVTEGEDIIVCGNCWDDPIAGNLASLLTRGRAPHVDSGGGGGAGGGREADEQRDTEGLAPQDPNRFREQCERWARELNEQLSWAQAMAPMTLWGGAWDAAGVAAGNPAEEGDPGMPPRTLT